MVWGGGVTVPSAVLDCVLPSLCSGGSLANLVRNGNGLRILRPLSLFRDLVRERLTESPFAWSRG